MINFDTSLTRIEGLEVAQVEFSVPADVECFADVEVRGFAVDQDGDVYDTGEVVKKRALCQVAWEKGIKTYRVKAVLPGDEGQGVLKIYAGKRGLIVGFTFPPKNNNGKLEAYSGTYLCSIR
jgi:transglutaminase/protease-like cytokinesis protein 3